ncbi:zinc finger BED domain-containing protein RICESLEEPER 2-like [Panicum miliaceum]|uniref:Zinc finger BED domain-containing protein RICESLEEPER 2-like n=1 Tax=Panicum miliaceum TaxID=4540 RepID=A0A3L6QVM1_PANMI|nr:zinc finger BED domain-containing protein RICESLEEPER 2-like [Panicum miliaceum]
MVLAIIDVLLDETWNSNELLNELADAMQVKFEKYWSKPNIVLLIAAVLDPSMKVDFIKFYFYTVGENVDMKIRELKRTSLAPETLEVLICAKDWLIGFNDDDEGEPMSG